MTKEQFEREKNYQVSLLVAKNMLEENLIDHKEYQKINKALVKKYNPIIGGLYA
ncbi:SHOCT domain-containing protein [Sporanaerobacter acetigenes]|mgnify:CR=1 FL=1|uniref:SHOCT-like domain-containing protein n=1 Tax=Sporanaerobacter acetigenes DSM 13106 TaxID=1123281 RepID=A0A1M5Z1L3_9FIRM|nr:SHOCT domain-containing protein [Sporanaerobacter acetigenes]SHI17968.1 hypothetical protein SAMN02745180_02631 [Sporanaerobacter acetigenes DSM 13106]